jgi:hypothetical protein
MIKRLVKIKTTKQHLSVSLPTSIPEDILKELNPLVDMIHIMAYGKTDLASIQKKLIKFNKININKISLALRPKDFKDEYNLEIFIDELFNNTIINNFSIHDIKQYMNACLNKDSETEK